MTQTAEATPDERGGFSFGVSQRNRRIGQQIVFPSPSPGTIPGDRNHAVSMAGQQSDIEKERLPLREVQASAPIKLKESSSARDSDVELIDSDSANLGLIVESKPTISKHEPAESALPNLGEDLDVISFIGEGGMGFVYRVLDKRLDKEFAVKLLRKELARDQMKLARFKQEVDSATNLDHPNLVTVYHHAIAPDGTPYMVMDFVNGSSLAEMLTRDVFLEPMRANALFLQICDGVAHAHLNGVVHLDLKPSNVLVAQNDNVEIAKVSDFGIAQVMTDDSQQISQTEEIVGSLPYMSPEHCRGESLDYRSDVYSLGCLMYEVLTGKPPFVGENPVKTIMKHIQDKPPRLKSRLTRLDIPEGLEKIVLHCLEKNPEHRYQNTEELIKDLELVRDGAEPHIATQQELALKSLDGQERQKQVRIWLSIGFVGLCFYFAHLSQFDTLNQMGKLFQSTANAVIVAGCLYCCSRLLNFHKQIAHRIAVPAQIRAGDRWLSLTTLSAIATFLFVIGMKAFNFFIDNQIMDLTTMLGFTHKGQESLESMIFVILLIVVQLSLLIWYFRQKTTVTEQKQISGW